MPGSGIEAQPRAERDALHRRVGRRRHRRGERGPRISREVAPPAVQLRRLRGGETEHGDPADSLGVPDAAANSHHRHRGRASCQRGVAGERRGVEHGDERLQVLADDDVERDGERRLIALGLDERGAIPLGEQRQGKREREEGNGDGSRTRPTAERHGCEARPDAAVEQAAGQPDERAEEARRRDGGRERDQAGQEEQDETCVLALGEPRLVGRAAEQGRNDERDRADRGDIEQAEAALGPGGHRRRDRNDQRREHDDARRDGEPGRREDALTEHGTDGSARAARRQRAHRDADEPADHRAGHGDDRHSRSR